MSDVVSDVMSSAAHQECVAMIEQFNTLGREASAILDAESPRLEALLAERDALLARLTTALATPGANGSSATLAGAIETASRSTAALITEVAQRTDALRAEIRELGRGARATSAYQAHTATAGRVHVSR